MEKKPILFEGACIFSLIGSSIGILYTLITVVFFNFVMNKVEQFTNITATEKLSRLYFVLLMSAFCISLTGIIKLYRMQRAGLYFYLVAQLMILFIPVIWLGPNAISVTNTIFTILFTSVYIYYFKRLS